LATISTMIVVLSKGVTSRERERIRACLQDRGFTPRDQRFGEDEIIGASGRGEADLQELALLPGVERVAATSKPYELASRETKPEDSIVSAGSGPGAVKIGGSRITVIAGPCAVESREQIRETAERVRESGAVLLRGGAYKPRTSPYAFQGLGMKGLEYIKEAGLACGMPIVTEVVSPELAIDMKDLTDMFQIGARNMQNFGLLKKVGSLGKPVLLKRGASATIEEWLLSAEYLLAAGTRDVVLCERGIRTFETYTRNTLDISAIPVVKGLSHLPVIVDPSHAVGIRDKVASAALAAIAAGADGLTVEVHPRPDDALSDGPQSLYPEQFEKLMRDIEALAPVVGKELLRTPRPWGASVPGAGKTAPASAAADAEKSGAVSIPADAEPFPGKGPAAYNGESGAFAEQALMRVFGEEAPRLRVQSFQAVFDAVLDGSAAAGIVPVENSLTGSIHENYDLFLRYPDIAIAGEVKLRILHCLVGNERAGLDSITMVRSHPQGFAQCREFLDQHPSWRLETWNDTAGAAASIAREGTVQTAAIAGEAAAKLYGLKVLKEGIETNPLNYTRFLIISRRLPGGTEIPWGEPWTAAWIPPSLGSGRPTKASLVFSIPDRPGSLFACLKIMADAGVNLSKLESRPIQGKPWEYQFYADVQIPQQEGSFAAVMEKLQTAAGNLRFLGAYRGSA
jgi:3-deoxy-7-phosphoheptulonate synthase